MQFLRFYLMHLNRLILSKYQKSNYNSRIIRVLIVGEYSLRGEEKCDEYLELLSSNVNAANVLTNGSIVLVLLKMFRDSKVSSLLHVQLASRIGLLIRDSTFFGDELANSGILGD
ncbi:hypothetical protein AABB24_009605 [Solanum stoloniferum]|uniref:Uncharacterized protein n=1 Tax=Solanum stoloniferum TaxID=62892 RepID=A0ABD2UMY1_9SOLN